MVKCYSKSNLYSFLINSIILIDFIFQHQFYYFHELDLVFNFLDTIIIVISN